MGRLEKYFTQALLFVESATYGALSVGARSRAPARGFGRPWLITPNTLKVFLWPPERRPRDACAEIGDARSSSWVWIELLAVAIDSWFRRFSERASSARIAVCATS